MSHLRRLIAFAPRSFMVVSGLEALIMALFALSYGLNGQFLGVAAFTALACGALCEVLFQMKFRWPHRRAIKLRNQLRRKCKEWLGGSKKVRLTMEDGKVAVGIDRHFAFVGWRYTVVVATLDKSRDAKFDWNLTFSQQETLTRLQFFHFLPAVGYVQRQIWRVRDTGDRAEGGPVGPIANEPELLALLYLLNGSVTVNTEGTSA